MSQQGRLVDAPSDLETLTGNTGGAVGSDATGNIDIVGSGTVTVTGNPGTNTLTITDTGTVATTYTTDSGNATPAANILNVLGGTGVSTSGAGNTVTIDASATTPLSFPGDAGTAIPAANALTVAGGTNINTVGAVATLTVNLDSAVLGLTDLTVDNLELNGNTLSSTDTNGNINVTPDGTGGVIIPTNLTLGETDQDVTYTINGATINAVVAVHTEGATDLGGFTEERHTDIAGFGPHHIFLRTRGDEATSTAVADGDALSRIISCGYDGTDFSQSAEIRAEVDGTPGNDDMPGRIKFLTSPDGTQVPVLAMTIDSSQDITLANALAVGSGGTGATTFTDGSILIGAGTSPITTSTDVQTTAVHGWNGAILETADVTVTSDGATITCSVEQSGTGDLTVVFSDGYYDWDTTPPDTVTLTAGSDTSPQINYVYFLQSTKTLTSATGGWPAAEHAPISTVICQSAASLQTDGPYKVHVWTDHVIQTDNQGHISDINFWIRNQSATWVSGVNQTYTITTNGGSPDNVILTTVSGIVLQLHDHSFPAFSGTPDIYVINDSVTPYLKITDLNAIDADSNGVSLVGRFYSLVIWGVVSEADADCKLYCNLPSGSYNNTAGVESDLDQFADYSIPSEFKGTGFLISEWKLRQQAAASGTWTSIDEIDLRGILPSSSVGGGSVVNSEFVDNAFRILDDADNTKEIAFQADQITTATTRTITMADYDIDIADVCISAPTDSGTATPASGALTFAGTNGIATSGAGSTVTIDGSAISDFDWNVEAGASAAMVVNNGYIGNNAGTVTFTLPDTAAVGAVVRVTAIQGAWAIAQNAGETIYFGSSSTTTGVGGSLTSTDSRDAIELVCVVANTDWNAISSIGNITVV